jgi:c-di-GMP-related signal transduction protein
MEFIARQPIFDVHRRVAAYELLFRSSEDNCCAETDLNMASKRLIDTAMLIGLDVLSGGHTIYLNCTEELLCDEYPTIFPPEQTVVEVLETVEATEPVVAACRELKAAGYTIALDDFEDRPDRAALVDLADVIKVDFRLTSPTDRAAMVGRYGNNGRIMLAEKVETDEEFSVAVTQGYSLFQGYFFCRPAVLSTPSVSSVNSQQIQILRLLGSPVLDFPEVEKLIRSDPALCFRLLRYLNSAAFGFRGEIRSILQALTLLGESELRKWLLIVSTISAGRKQPELVRLALIRARFLELLGPAVGISKSLLFLLGLLSLMDAILELPLSSITEKLAVPATVRSALLGEPSRLRDCFDLALTYENADWESCRDISAKCAVPPGSLSQYYGEALAWAGNLVTT